MMSIRFRKFHIFVCAAAIVFFLPLSGFQLDNRSAVQFPWQQAGLTDRQAAAHLIGRFTFGSTPDQVDAVIKMGMEKWFEQQLAGSLNDAAADQRLKKFDALKLSNREIVSTYLKGGQVLKMAVADGAVNKDSAKSNNPTYKAQLRDYMLKKGIKSERELARQLIAQKIVRATYSVNQLHEVLTDFWFNHFNVSFTKGSCGQFIPDYERDVIRPNVAGKFEELLIATAKSPAMLLYLDNFSSAGVQKDPARARVRPAARKIKVKGLNENYAREVMELHTLGVDGGYTQGDVTEGARILTGWTIAPMGKEAFGTGYQKLLEKVGESKLQARGFVQDGDFLFTPNRHDMGAKLFLGKRFAGGVGYEEGVHLLQMLAHHPSTARFVSKEIATRFVSDKPPVSLIDKMAKTWQATDGDVGSVLITMVSSSEFWDPGSLREKTKSPFELAISAVRALHAEVTQPYQLFTWINRMGQPLYSYQAPTGFPDRGQYWINTGSLLNRMNFGLALADGRIPGVKFDLLALNMNHEPESADAALLVYCKLLMPERNTDETVQRLTPLLNDPTLQQKIGTAAGVYDADVAMKSTHKSKADSLLDDSDVTEKVAPGAEKYRLSQVVGILIGSPEFQRR